MSDGIGEHRDPKKATGALAQEARKTRRSLGSFQRAQNWRGKSVTVNM